MITLEPDYSVEIALLIDVARDFGVHALAQVDLGIRRHRNRPLDELRPMAVDVLRAALERYKVDLPDQRPSYLIPEFGPRMTMTSSVDAPVTGERPAKGCTTVELTLIALATSSAASWLAPV